MDLIALVDPWASYWWVADVGNQLILAVFPTEVEALEYIADLRENRNNEAQGG